MSGGLDPVIGVPTKGGRTPGPVGRVRPATFAVPGPAGMQPVQRSAQQITPDDGQETNGPRTLLDSAIASLTRDYPLSDSQLDVLRQALRAFADRQLTAFVDAGVRFWPTGSLPPNIAAAMTTPDDPQYGHYIVQARTIRIRSNYWRRHVVTHELVHAWDRLRGRNRLRSFHTLRPAQLRQAIFREARVQAWSERNLAVAYQNYRSMLLRRFGRNGNPTQDTYAMAFDALRGYSFRHNVREFYAEGYAIFQFGSLDNKTRLYVFARPLYDALLRDAQTDGLPVPNQGELHQLARRDRLIR